MSKPRKLSALIGRVLESCNSLRRLAYRADAKIFEIVVTSSTDFYRMKEDVDLPVSMEYSYKSPADKGPCELEELFNLHWDCSELGESFHGGQVGFSFDRSSAKRDRRRVTQQEEEGARMIGGERHIGSGALSGLESDASSDVWQQEAKQTKARSYRLEAGVLEKISREARTTGKSPMVFLRFLDLPESMIAENDWVIIPRTAFEKRVSNDDGKGDGDEVESV